MPAAYDGVWHVTWAHPYRPAPGPVTLARVVVRDWPQAESHAAPAEIREMAMAHPGYGLCWSWQRPEGYKRRTWSKEAKARGRVRRLRERMERRYPLFAEAFVQEAIAANPAYYRAEDPFYDKERESDQE